MKILKFIALIPIGIAMAPALVAVAPMAALQETSAPNWLFAIGCLFGILLCLLSLAMMGALYLFVSLLSAFFPNL